MEFEAKFHIPLIEGYGLSETSPVVTKNPLDGTRKAGSIGLPIPQVEVSIQDDAGRLLGVGENGEVCVRGGNVMLGYWKQPAETAKVMRNGWLLTGDIGYRDQEGYYFITDRKKDMLLVNGINVYPREIEEILYQFPGVKEAAVIGKPDSRKGDLMGPFARQFFPFVAYRPAFRRRQSHDCPVRRGFPHAVSAEKGYDHSLPYLQRDVEKDVAFPVVSIDFTDLQHR